MSLQIRDDRHLRALTGLAEAKFEQLLPVFSEVYQEEQHTPKGGLAAGTRRSKPGGGQKGKLPTMEEKLQFILYFYKVYPTFDVLGSQFEIARSKANE